MQTDRDEALNQLKPGLVEGFISLATSQPGLVEDFLSLATSQPDQVCDFLGALKNDPVRAEPVDDYITDLNRRLHLFQTIRQYHFDLQLSGPTASIFAYVMIGPVEEIETLISTIQQTPQLRHAIIPGLGCNCTNAIKSYIRKGNRSIEQPVGLPRILPAVTLGPSGSMSSTTRSGGPTAKARDGYSCIISGKGNPEAAHIFPFATSKDQKFGALNYTLRDFWGAQAADAWRKLYEDDNITQSAKNCISLNQRIHFLFDTAKFALKPLRQGNNEIVVQWHWLRTTRLKPNTKIGSAENPLSWAGLTEGKRWGDDLEHRKSGALVKTGQTFVIRADNPDDLPSFELLKLQWDLLRVAAICGAGEATDEDFETENDDDDGADFPCIPIRGSAETVHDLEKSSH